MLIVISAMFVILHIPSLLVLIYFSMTPHLEETLENGGLEAVANFMFWAALGLHITEYQNSLNFFFTLYLEVNFVKPC